MLSKRYFIEEADVHKPFMRYIKPNAEAVPLKKIDVPGDSRKRVTRSDHARRGTCALVSWSINLYESGYCLVGTFRGSDFGIDFMGNLRGRKTLIPLLKRVTGQKMLKAQMRVVANIVLKDIHEADSVDELPEDLSHLLRLLTAVEIDCSLIVHHASHDDEDTKSALFDKLFKNLKALEASEPTTYAAIINAIAKIPDVHGWRESAMKNVHLHAVLRHKKLNLDAPMTLEDAIFTFLESRVRYGGDVVDLLDFRRNGHAHLEKDYSVDTTGHLEAGLFGASEAINVFYCQQKPQLHLSHAKENEDLLKLQEGEKQALQKEQQDYLDDLLKRQQEHLKWQQEHLKWQQEQQQKSEPNDDQGWQVQRRRRQHHYQPQQQQLQQQQHHYQPQHRQQQQHHQPQLWQQQQQPLHHHQEQLKNVENRHGFEQQEQQRFHNQEWQNQQEWHKEELEQLLRDPLPSERAGLIAHAIGQFLNGEDAKQLSAPALKAGAQAAALYLTTAGTDNFEAESTHAVAVAQAAADVATADTDNFEAESTHAVAVAQAAADVAADTPAQAGIPAVMFVAADVNLMQETVAPNLLVGLQELMFHRGKCYCLSTDKKTPLLK